MGYFRKELLYVLIISLGSFACGEGIAFYSPIGVPFTKDMNLSKSQGNWFNTIHHFAAVFGGPIDKLLISVFGRKKSIFITSLTSIISFVLIAVTKKNYYWLGFLGRAIMGLCTGSFSGLCSMYIVEIAPTKYRGSYGVCHQLMITIGISYIYLLGIFCNWFTISLLCLIPVILLSIFIFFVPDLVSEEDSDFEKETNETIFQRKFIKPFAVSIFLILFQQFSGINPILSNLEEIFSNAHIRIDASVCSLIVGIAQVFATLIASFCVEKLGRRISWIVSSSGQAVALFLMFSEKKWKYTPYIALVSLLIDVFSFGIAFGPVPWMIVPELFPDSVRALAVSLMTGLNWLISSVTLFIWDPIVSHLGESWGFLLFFIFCTIACLYGIFFMPETKGMEIGEICDP